MGQARRQGRSRARNAALSIAIAVGCGPPEPPQTPPVVVEQFPVPAEPSSTLPLAPVPPILLRGVGLESPDSAVHDAVADVYLISNVGGGLVERDNDGFISKVSPEGTLIDLKWISAEAAKITLNAPKGMALIGETLFVADIDVVRAFDRATGKALGDVAIPSATFLNGVAAAGDGTLYVSDTGLGKAKGSDELTTNGSDAVYAIDAQRSVKKLASGVELAQPNGLIAQEAGVLVAGGSGEVYQLDLGGQKTPVGKLAVALDGLVRTPGGRLLVSSWPASTVFIDRPPPAPPGEFEPLIAELASPAGLAYDPSRRQLIVPLFRENAVYIQELPGDVN
jgi:hypothetical protein